MPIRISDILKAGTVDRKIVHSSEVFDDSIGKFQSEINLGGYDNIIPATLISISSNIMTLELGVIPDDMETDIDPSNSILCNNSIIIFSTTSDLVSPDFTSILLKNNNKNIVTIKSVKGNNPGYYYYKDSYYMLSLKNSVAYFLNDLKSSKISISESGNGNSVTDISFDSSTRTLNITKGDSFLSTSGGSMKGYLKFPNDSAITSFSGQPEYLLGIEAFPDGTVKYQENSNIKVGYASNADLASKSNYPTGFSSMRTPSYGNSWGLGKSIAGTCITDWVTPNGGDIAFLEKGDVVSIQLDGTVYINEGNDEVATKKSVTTETSERKTADETITTNLNNEISRAKAREDDLMASIPVDINVTGGGSAEGSNYVSGVVTEGRNITLEYTDFSENSVIKDIEDTQDILYSYHLNREDIIHFKDAEVKRVLLDKGVGGTVIPGEITYDEAAQVTSLEDWFNNNEVIVSFNELKYFTGLTGIGDQTGTSYEDYKPFYQCSNLNEVSIPDSVTYIGYGAFYNCYNLKSVEFGLRSQCSRFEDFCFYKSIQKSGVANALDNFKFPLGTVYIGEGAFYECYMHDLNIEDLWSLETISRMGFGGYGGSGIYDPDYDLIIPSSVTSIGYAAFAGSVIKSITILGDPTIVSSAFAVYTNVPETPNVFEKFIAPFLTELTTFAISSNNSKYIDLPKATVIYNNVFQHNAYLEELNLPSAETLQQNFIAYCPNLKYFKIASTVTTLNQYAFGNSYIETLEVESQTACSSTVEWARNTGGLGTGFKKLIIGDNITSIGSKAFNNCDKLEEVVIGSGVTSIDEAAFTGCNQLKKITIRSNSLLASTQSWLGVIQTMYEVIIDDTVTSIGADAFKECSYLRSIQISDSVTSLGHDAFNSCTNLQNVTLSKSITAIESWTFVNCSYLTSITIPNSVTSIGNYAFFNCSNLTSVTIPNSVTSISRQAFCNCSRLTNISIPNSVTSIGIYTFSNCSRLTNISIPNSVTSIDDGAFSNCSLTSITIPSSVTFINNRIFYGCTSLTSIIIPNSVTSIGSYAFSNCSSLTSITIPTSVTSIGSDAFSNCTSLQSIKFLSTTPLSDITFLSTLNTTCKIYVPQSALESYRTSWSSYKDRILPIYSEKSVVGVEQGSTDTSIKITNVAGTTSEVTLGSSTYATKTELSDYVTLDEANENLVIS